MNLIITINNAQMIIEKENLGRSEIKRREYLCRHGEIQLTSSKNKKKKNQTLNKRNPSQIPILGEQASDS